MNKPLSLKKRTILIGWMICMFTFESACVRLIILRDPLTAEQHLKLGLSYLHEGELVAAQRSFERALRKDPNSVDAWYNLGYTLALRKKWKRARYCFKKSYTLSKGKCADCLNNLVFVLIQQKKAHQSSLVWMKRLIHTQPLIVFEYLHTAFSVAYILEDCRLMKQWLAWSLLNTPENEQTSALTLPALYYRECSPSFIEFVIP